MEQERARQVAKEVIDNMEADKRQGGRLGRNVIMQRTLNRYGVTTADWSSAWRQVSILVDRELREAKHADEAAAAARETEVPTFVDDGEPIDYVPTSDGQKGVLVEVIGHTSRTELCFRNRQGRLELTEGDPASLPHHVLDAARRAAAAHLTRA
jgi:hypothetical protein